MWPLHFAADLGRDNGFGSDRFDGGNDCIRVVASIGHHNLGLAASEQRQGLGELSSLSAGEAEGDRLSQAVGQQVDLGAQSTSGTPQSLVFAPFLRPVAAC